MNTPVAAVGSAPSLAGRTPSDLRSLGPWYLAVILNSYSATLFLTGCFDFADKQLHVSAANGLWLSALYGFAYIFISLSSGKLTERFGARRTLFFMTPACVATYLFTLLILRVPLSTGWATWALAGLMLPCNVTSSACWPALESVISRASARLRLSSRMSLYNMSWAVAGFAAYFTRGALEEFWWGSIFLVPAIIMAISIGALWRYSIAPDVSASRSSVVPTEEPAAADPPELRRRALTLLHMAWIGNALAYVAINVMLPVLMKLSDETGVTNLTLAGILTSAWGCTRLAGFLLAGKWTAWHYKARWLVGSQFALGGSFLLILVVHQIWVLILAQIVFGLSTALIYSSSLYYAMHTSEGSGDHAGFHEALIGIGTFIGPAVGAMAGGSSVGAQALNHIGFSVATVLFAGTLVMAWMGARRRAPRKLLIES